MPCSNICTVAVTGFPAFAFPIEGEDTEKAFEAVYASFSPIGK
jgi:hypothetical protein